MKYTKKIESNLLAKSFNAWFDGLGSVDRAEAKLMVDAFLTGGAVGKGANGEDTGD